MFQTGANSAIFVVLWPSCVPRRYWMFSRSCFCCPVNLGYVIEVTKT